MKEYMESFMDKQFFSKDAIKELRSIYRKIMKDDTLCDIFYRAIDLYANDAVCDFEEVLALCEELEENSLIHEYSVNLFFFICLTQHLKERYINAGISEDIWTDTVSDLKYKMIECKDITNVWGIIDKESLAGVFKMERFTLGRLQFEVVRFGDIMPGFEYKKDGVTLSGAAKVIKVHIPRMLRQLDNELCDESYAMAAEFFGEEFKDEPVVFVCKSWMLFPDFEPVTAGTDISSFAQNYEVVAVSVDRDGEMPDMQEVFNMEFTGRAENYPENTMLRKRFKEYLINGGKTGRGIGIKIL